MAAAGDQENNGGSESTEYQLKKYLLLLATLVATVTYAAGLNLPGGTWVEDPPEGQLAGDSILRATNYTRYIVFFYVNAIAFAASLLVGLLLLILHRNGSNWGGWMLTIVRVVMVADLVCLMCAYAVGSSHDWFTTACGATVLTLGVLAYAVALVTTYYWREMTPWQASVTKKEEVGEKEREILLVLAVFAATIAYVAGLNPPGGFWRRSSEEGHHHHAAGEPVLQGLHRARYRAFFVFNTSAFAASLLAIMLLVSSRKLHKKLQSVPVRVTKFALYGPVVTAILGLWFAYTFGSCRDRKHTAYVVLVFFAVAVVSCLLQLAARYSCCSSIKDRLAGSCCLFTSPTCWSHKCWGFVKDRVTEASHESKSLLERGREDIQLLAILAATIAYSAAVDPPGGVWVETGDGHRVGDPILLTTHPLRYKLFFYFNSAAFVASLVIMVMLQWEVLVRKHALEALMILDLFGLIGAFAAGGSRDTSTSFYTVALAGAVLIYVVLHIVFTMDGAPPAAAAAAVVVPKDGEEDKLQKKRDVLLLLAILAATLTYQAGLTPPGGCWERDDPSGERRAGFPVLQDKYPRRYTTFYYCNAAGFMASVALIVLLLNHNLYRPGIRCYALYVCMVAGMLSLMGAYSAGSSFHLRTSIIVLVLAGTLAAVSFAVAFFVRCIRRESRKSALSGEIEAAPTTGEDQAKQPASPRPAPAECEGQGRDEEYMMYLMMVGILGASVTYLTGLKPPGGVWRDDGDGHAAGNPVLYDTSKHRYNAFFYSNSVAFMASVAVIASLLWRMVRPRGEQAAVRLWPMHAAMVVDMLALLGAYAAGGARKWGSSTKVVLLLVPALLFVWVVLYFRKQSSTPAAAVQPSSVNGAQTAQPS